MNLPVFSISRTHSLYMFLRTDKSISYVMLLNGQNNRGNVSFLFGFINNTQAHTCSDTIFSTPLTATYMPHFIALSMIPQQNYGKIIVKVIKITPLAHPINSSLPRRGLRSRHNFYFNPPSERGGHVFWKPDCWSLGFPSCTQFPFGLLSSTTRFRYLHCNIIPLVKNHTNEGMSLWMLPPCTGHLWVVVIVAGQALHRDTLWKRNSGKKDAVITNINTER